MVVCTIVNVGGGSLIDIRPRLGVPPVKIAVGLVFVPAILFMISISTSRPIHANWFP